MARHFAIVGSGPAGIYAAERLARIAPDDLIDVIDRLPVPFGLVRHGVAADHQSTKAVTRVLGRALGRDNVSFVGNVMVGRDVTLADLRQWYDAVILATGAPRDRRLGISGEDLTGVHGSGAFVGWLNGHPDQTGLAIDLHGVTDVVVVGVGNVALDVARIFAKSPTELAAADLAPDVAEALAALTLKSITLLGRRGAEDAKFTALELSEMGDLERARPVVAQAALPPACDDEAKPLSILRGFSSAQRDDQPLGVHFLFHTRPLAFEGSDRLTGVRVVTAGGAKSVLPAQLAITCIGYDSVTCGDLEPASGVFANQDGKVEDGLYVVGWAKRGPSGTIPTNRAESHEVANRVAAETEAAGRPGAAGLIEQVGDRIVDLDGWGRIDAAETARATGDRPRHKFTTIDEMVAAARP
ncbi:MAG: FAD-dependent oxidoreductase [Pseudomonadota bacterium]